MSYNMQEPLGNEHPTDSHEYVSDEKDKPNKSPESSLGTLYKPNNWEQQMSDENHPAESVEVKNSANRSLSPSSQQWEGSKTSNINSYQLVSDHSQYKVPSNISQRSHPHEGSISPPLHHLPLSRQSGELRSSPNSQLLGSESQKYISEVTLSKVSQSTQPNELSDNFIKKIDEFESRTTYSNHSNPIENWDAHKTSHVTYSIPLESEEPSRSYLAYSLSPDEYKSKSPSYFGDMEASRTSQMTHLSNSHPSRTQHMAHSIGSNDVSLASSRTYPDNEASRISTRSYLGNIEPSRTSQMSQNLIGSNDTSRISHMTHNLLDYEQASKASSRSFTGNEASRISTRSNLGDNEPSKMSQVTYSYLDNNEALRKSFIDHLEPSRLSQTTYSYIDNEPLRTSPMTHSFEPSRTSQMTRPYADYEPSKTSHITYATLDEPSRKSQITHSSFSGDNYSSQRSKASKLSQRSEASKSSKRSEASKLSQQYDESKLSQQAYSQPSDITYPYPSENLRYSPYDGRAPRSSHVTYVSRQSPKSFYTPNQAEELSDSMLSYTRRTNYPSEHTHIERKIIVPPEMSKTSPGLYGDYTQASPMVDDLNEPSKDNLSVVESIVQRSIKDGVPSETRTVRTTHTVRSDASSEDFAASTVAMNLNDKRSISSRQSSRSGKLRIHPSSIIGDHQSDQSEKTRVLRSLSEEVRSLYKQIDDIQSSPERGQLYKVPILQSIVKHFHEMVCDIKQGVCVHESTSFLPQEVASYHSHERSGTIPSPARVLTPDLSPTPSSPQVRTLAPAPTPYPSQDLETSESESADGIPDLHSRATESPDYKISEKNQMYSPPSVPNQSIMPREQIHTPVGYQLGPPSPGLVAVYPVYTVYPLYST